MLFLTEGYRLDRHTLVLILLFWVVGADEAQSSGYRVERGKCTFKYVTMVL